MEEYKQIGPYIYIERKSELLGEGGFGKVYKCKNIEQPDLPLCIKIIQLSKNPKQQEKQIREVKIMVEIKSKFLSNQNLVRMEDIYFEDEKLYIIMERCEGSLYDLLVKHPLTPEQALTIVQQIVNGYRDLAGNNIIHRDIKLENILYTGNVFKISDFGLARFLDCEPEMMSNCGTRSHKSPQIVLREGYTNKADIYSLGITFFQLIYRKLPYLCSPDSELYKSLKKIKKRPIKLWEHKRGLTQSIRDLIESMLRYEEEDRIDWQQLFKHPLINQPIQFNLLNQYQPNNQQQQNIGRQRSSLSENITQSLSSDEQTEIGPQQIQIVQFEPLTHIYQFDCENARYCDQQYMAGILHVSALVYIDRNQHLKEQNILDYFSMIVYFTYHAIKYLIGAIESKNESNQQGIYSLQQIESALNFVSDFANQLERNLQEKHPELMDQLRTISLNFQQQGMKYSVQLFPFESQQQYSLQYLQLLFLLEKINELTLNEFYNLVGEINLIQQTIENQVEILKYLQEKRNR